MSEAEVTRIEIALQRLEAVLSERCPRHLEAVKKNTVAIDAAWKKIREHEKMFAKWSLISSFFTAILTAAAVTFFVG